MRSSHWVMHKLSNFPLETFGFYQRSSLCMSTLTLLSLSHSSSNFRCAQGDVVTHTAWLNRSSILYAGEDKWSVDPRVSLVALNQDEFTIKIENVDMTDEGQYVCAVQTSSRPRTTSVHLIVQGNTQCNNHSIQTIRRTSTRICSFVFRLEVSFSFIAPLGQLETKCLAHGEGRKIASHWLCYMRLMGSTKCYGTPAKMMYGEIPLALKLICR